MNLCVIDMELYIFNSQDVWEKSDCIFWFFFHFLVFVTLTFCGYEYVSYWLLYLVPAQDKIQGLHAIAFD